MVFNKIKSIFSRPKENETIDYYKEIGQLLFNVTPDVDTETNLHIFIRNSDSVNMTLWTTSYMSKETSFSIPTEVTLKIRDIVLEMKKKFKTSSKAVWNEAHYVLAPKGKSFDIQFSDNKALANNEISLWRYRANKFKRT